ncbi:MAG: flavodoxin family protein [Acidobacteria bacterium]|nr:flavodoxin family protein [Acidobacteriota bacterium]
MKIVCVLGSPRPQGNTAALARHFCDEAGKLGAECSVYALNKLGYRACQGCYACKSKVEKCILSDDLTRVLDAAAEADVLVLATPVYYGDVTAQMKGFIDRTFSWLKPDFMTNPSPSRLEPGKTLVFILAQGQPDTTMFADVAPRYEQFFKFYGFKESRVVRACGVNQAGDVLADPFHADEVSGVVQSLLAPERP